MYWAYFLLALLITIFVHELGHLVSALLLGVKVEAFSIGFGIPYLHKKIKGIDYRLSPLPFGGYTKLAGEYDKTIPNGFLAQRYSKKVIILIAGVSVNLMLAFLCYLLHYGSIGFGIQVDIALISAIATKNIPLLIDILVVIKPNMFLLLLGLMNFSSFFLNLIPFPALDGGTIWTVLLEKVIKKDFGRWLTIINWFGFIILMILQIIIICWLYMR